MSALEQNIAKTQQYLARFQGKPLGHFINGSATAGLSGDQFENHTPIDNSVLNTVASGNAADIDAAAQAAKAASPEWRA